MWYRKQRTEQLQCTFVLLCMSQVSFRSYWTRVLLEILRDHRGNLSIKVRRHNSGHSPLFHVNRVFSLQRLILRLQSCNFIPEYYYQGIAAVMLTSHRCVWTVRCMGCLQDLSSMTAIRTDDIISTLQSLNLIK